MPTEPTLSERAPLHPWLAVAASLFAAPACASDFAGWELFEPGRGDAGFDVEGGTLEDRADSGANDSRAATADGLMGGGSSPADGAVLEASGRDGADESMADDGGAVPDASDARPDVVPGDSAGDPGRDGDAGRADAGRDTGIVGPGALLDRQRWELPCGRTMQNGLLCENTSPLGKDCPGGSDRVSRTVTFGGTPGTRYQVVLRVRGVVEPKSYQNGSARGGRFYVGGRPTSSVHNVYGFFVSSPPETYYVNADEGQGEPSRVVALDTMATVIIEGGATVELFVSDSDCAMVRNCEDSSSDSCTPRIVPGVPPAPAPFDGQFVQLDLLAVSP